MKAVETAPKNIKKVYDIEVHCKVCEKIILDQDFCGKRICSDCLPNYMAELRTFYGEYHSRLKEFLKSRKIYVSDAGIEGGDLNDTVVFTVAVRDAIFSISDDGYVGYVKESPERSFMDNVEKRIESKILALASDGLELYALTDNGVVVSTQEMWQEYQLYDWLDEVKRITYQKFSSQDIEKLVKEIEQGKVRWSWREYYYDYKQKAFIFSDISGNPYHEGISKEYRETDCQHVLKMMKSDLIYWGIIHIFNDVKNGKIPEEAIVELLPVHPAGEKIILPESYMVY